VPIVKDLCELLTVIRRGYVSVSKRREARSSAVSSTKPAEGAYSEGSLTLSPKFWGGTFWKPQHIGRTRMADDWQGIVRTSERRLVRWRWERKLTYTMPSTHCVGSRAGLCWLDQE
jgi:hypothetical protein